SLLFAVLISTVNFQFDVFAKVRCTQHREEAIANLHQLRVFDRSAIAESSETRSGYLQMRAYIRMLDYLRLLMLEYLQMA
ncbi:hypothetical protein QUA40_28365, partial [Microcoleus sp. Pol11C3]|uniref:hypothetical protein n=1 Tax=Microcoleus sp. Pol11C3 TaxID=3055390 RepID=UPI002FD2FFB5